MAIALLMFQRRRHNEEIDSYNTNEFAGGFPGDPERTCLCRRQPPGQSQGSVKSCAVIKQLERLRQRRNQEIRQGDRREAREYNEKIRDQQREIRQDRKNIYGDRYDGVVMGADRDRWHHGYNHE